MRSTITNPDTGNRTAEFSIRFSSEEELQAILEHMKATQTYYDDTLVSGVIHTKREYAKVLLESYPPYKAKIEEIQGLKEKRNNVELLIKKAKIEQGVLASTDSNNQDLVSLNAAITTQYKELSALKKVAVKNLSKEEKAKYSTDSKILSSKYSSGSSGLGTATWAKAHEQFQVALCDSNVLGKPRRISFRKEKYSSPYMATIGGVWGGMKKRNSEGLEQNLTIEDLFEGKVPTLKLRPEGKTYRHTDSMDAPGTGKRDFYTGSMKIAGKEFMFTAISNRYGKTEVAKLPLDAEVRNWHIGWSGKRSRKDPNWDLRLFLVYKVEPTELKQEGNVVGIDIGWRKLSVQDIEQLPEDQLLGVTKKDLAPIYLEDRIKSPKQIAQFNRSLEKASPRLKEILLKQNPVRVINPIRVAVLYNGYSYRQVILPPDLVAKFEARADLQSERDLLLHKCLTEASDYAASTENSFYNQPRYIKDDGKPFYWYITNKTSAEYLFSMLKTLPADSIEYRELSSFKVRYNDLTEKMDAIQRSLSLGKDTLFGTIANNLAKTTKVLKVEDYSLAVFAKESINDGEAKTAYRRQKTLASPGSLVAKLAYAVKKQGGSVEEVKAAYTTLSCPCCGLIRERTSKMHMYCTNCDKFSDRDLDGAKNIYNSRKPEPKVAKPKPEKEKLGLVTSENTNIWYTSKEEVHLSSSELPIAVLFTFVYNLCRAYPVPKLPVTEEPNFISKSRLLNELGWTIASVEALGKPDYRKVIFGNSKKGRMYVYAKHRILTVGDLTSNKKVKKSLTNPVFDKLDALSTLCLDSLRVRRSRPAILRASGSVPPEPPYSLEKEETVDISNTYWYCS